MPTDKAAAAFEETYNKLHASFITRLKHSASSIDSMLAQTRIDETVLREAMKMAHGLAGSGTVFGFADVTQQGKVADRFMEQSLSALPPGSALEGENAEKFTRIMTALRDICQEASKIQAPAKAEVILPRKRSHSERAEDFSVLIVDDDKEVSEFVSLKLRQGGLRVMTAPDGESAIVALGRSIPDIVVLDISMPKMNGHQVLKVMKENPLYTSIPVLVLTAHTEQDHIVSALHSGALDYIVKPFDADKLVARLNKLLDARKFTVLIADNDLLVLQLLSRKFSDRGFKVIVSEDGKDAWEQIQRSLPDLVILDRMMPGMEGLSVLQKMREEKETREIPAIILSARGSPVDLENGKRIGAQDYVVKPFLPDDLVARSIKLIGRAESE